MNPRRFLGLALFVALAAFAAPAHASEAELVVSDVHIDAALRSVDLTVSAQGLPDGAGIDPNSVVAKVGDRTLPVTSVVSESASATPPRVLIVVDTSGSMQGQPMTDAKQAISEFVAQAPAGVQLGLMGFASRPELLVEPTPDRSRLLGAVTGLQAQGETSLYDAVRAGIAALGPTGDRRLVILSDGGDTRSTSVLDDALASTRDSGVVVDAIGFRTDETVQGVLEQIATSGRGRVHGVDTAAQLSAALASTTRLHARTLNVHVLVPDDLRGQQELALSVAMPDGTLHSSTAVALGAEPASGTGISWWGTRSALLVGIAAIGASLLLGSLLLLDDRRRDRRRVSDVLTRYTTAPATEKEDLRTASPVARTALQLAERVATQRNRQDRIALRLDRAAIAMTPAEWLLLQAGVAFGSTLLLVLLGMHLLLALLVGGLLGAVLPNRVLALRGARRQTAFEEKLPDMLQMTASSLSAGYSLAQALDGVVREGSEPMASEMGRALAESRLGVPVESTLGGVAERMQSRDFAWVVMAVRVQREVGGNLASILSTVSATMRERAMLRRQVRALSAEGRLSAYILLGLPVFLALYMLTVRREYIEPLYTTGIGLAFIAAAVVLMTVGSFVMSRMVKVEV